MVPLGLIHLILTITGVIFFDQESWLGLLDSFFPNSYLGSSGVFSPDYLRCDPVQLQRQVPGKVPVQRLGEVLEGSGADT